MDKTYKIKPGVKPYGGRKLQVVSETPETVTGYVHISRARVATAQRTYRREELEG